MKPKSRILTSVMERCDAVGVGMDSEPKVRQKAEIEEESRTSDRMGGRCIAG